MVVSGMPTEIISEIGTDLCTEFLFADPTRCKRLTWVV
jgi:hypothetical protein